MNVKMFGVRLRITWWRVAATLAVLFVLCLAIWQAMYPGPYDAKSLRYQAWKLGIPFLTQDQGLETMVVDAHSDSLVIGKTERDLAKRFGYVTLMNQAPEYYRFCYSTSGRPMQPALMLRNSNWMVLMKDGRAEDLVLLKGC